jgi:membrane protein DedA with SNARE-associated domain/rhodanese-related sulfurtransferase
MNETLEFLFRHGAAVIFAAVFVEQLGIPLPAAPWLLAAGALAGAGRMNWAAALGAAIVGALLADSLWFYLGRRYGNRVLGLLCRISLEPDTCVRRTQNLFTRYGMRAVLVAKFVPGLNTLAPPLAGSSGASYVQFLLFDGLSATMHSGTFILVGRLFSHQLEQIIDALAGLGSRALLVLGGLAALYIAYKYFQRRRLLRELRMARITVDELRQKQEAGENLIILDIRSLGEVKEHPALILGAVHMTMEEVERYHGELPRDREIVLYCSCPNEASSARVALLLRRKGIPHVRPLLGGIDAWRERSYPTEVGAAAAWSASAGSPPGHDSGQSVQVVVTAEKQSVGTARER